MKRQGWIAVVFGVLFLVAVFAVGTRFEGQRQRQERLCRELWARVQQVDEEAVAWARVQVQRVAGPDWEQTPSFDNLLFDEDDLELVRALDALCTWAKLQASADGCRQILERDTPYAAIEEIRDRLEVLRFSVRWPDVTPTERIVFDELDAEIQELIRI